MSALDEAIEVATGVTVDWEELGKAFSEEFPHEQGRFLVGMWQASTDSQAARIAEASIFGAHVNSTRGEVAEYLRLVADAIDKGGSR